MDRLEEAKFIINRYDHYYDSINNKGNLYLVLNTFILGCIISGYGALDKHFQFGCFFKGLLFAILLANMVSISLTLLAIRPFLSKQDGKKDKSLYYFVDVAQSDISGYRKAFKDVSEKRLLNDAISQIHKLATGLHKKFRKINLASMFIGGQVLLILIFAILLIIKY